MSTKALSTILPFVLCGCFIFSSNDLEAPVDAQDSDTSLTDVETDADDAEPDTVDDVDAEDVEADAGDIDGDAHDTVGDASDGGVDASDTLDDDVDAFTGPPGPYLRIHPDNPMWLQMSDGKPFFMCGTSTPEDFLYRGVRQSDGTRAGDQEAIIGRLAEAGANALYVVAVQDDEHDTTHNPFVSSDPDRGLNEAIIAQWSQWLEATDEAGIAVLFNIYGDSEYWQGESPDAEDDFIRALVTALRHHTHIIWSVAESYDEPSGIFSTDDIESRVALIREVDPYHPIAASTSASIRPGTVELLPETDMHAFELPEHETADENRAEALAAWDYGTPLTVMSVFESGYPTTGAATRNTNWALALGGINVMVHGWFDDPTTDEDLAACGYLHRFLEVDGFFARGLQPDDVHVASTSADYFFGNTESGTFVVYASELGPGGVRISGLSEATYTHRWLDAIAGYEYAGQNTPHSGIGAATLPRPSRMTTREVAVFVNTTDAGTAAISGRVRLDVDGDGDLSDADGGIAHVRVEVFEKDERLPRATTTTDENGVYRFIHLSPRRHVVFVADPAGYRSTQDRDGGNDDQVTVRLDAPREVGAIDFLLTPIPSSISGQVRLDRDGDGDLQSRDPGLRHAELTLFADIDCDGEPDGDAIGNTASDASGRYVFEEVVGGSTHSICGVKSYAVIETDPEGYASTADSDGPSNGANLITIELPTSGSSATGNDFLDTESR